MGISNQLKNMNDAFAVIASFPEIKEKPIVIGESDPDGCAACTGPQLGYRNGTLYSSYTAASFARAFEIADQHGVNLDGALTWAFEFEDQPYFAGQRVLATNGIDLPVLNVFRMFGKMGGQRLEVQSSADAGAPGLIKNGVRENPDVYALTGLEPKKLSIMVWNYHDEDVPGPTAAVDLQLSGLPLDSGDAKLTHYRIDHDHSNAYTAWQNLGSPQQPTPDQYAQLEQAGQLALLNDPATVSVQGGKTSIKITLPRQAVSLLVLEWN
jgi:xylan 1,4-beta-xylosidase